MKRFVLFLWIAIAAVPGGSWGVVRAAGADVVQRGPERRHRGYVKDDWSVWYRGRKVEGAVASSFSDLGGATARMPGRSFTAAGRWRGCRIVVRRARRRVRQRLLVGLVPGLQDRGVVGLVVLRSGRRLRQGPLEGGFRGSHGEGRRGLVVRKPRQRLCEGCMEGLLPGRGDSGSVAGIVQDAAAVGFSGRFPPVFRSKAFPAGMAFFHPGIVFVFSG